MVYPRKDCLQQSTMDALGRSIRPEKHTFAISSSGHFYIHYDTTGVKAPVLIDNDNNGIPDYVDEVSRIADSSRHVLVNIMGYTSEPYYF